MVVQEGAIWVEDAVPPNRQSACQQLNREEAGAPLPLRCNTRAIELQRVRLLEQGVTVEVLVGCTKPPTRCNKRAIDVQLDCPIEGKVIKVEHVGSPLPRHGDNSHAEKLANSVPARYCRAIVAMVTEDLKEVLGAVIGKVAALKRQDCGYVLLHKQQGVVCLPGEFRRPVRRPSVRPPLALALSSSLLFCMFRPPPPGSFGSRTAVLGSASQGSISLIPPLTHT